MADDTLVDRLKRLHDSLLRINAETVELRHQIERNSLTRRFRDRLDVARVIPVRLPFPLRPFDFVAPWRWTLLPRRHSLVSTILTGSTMPNRLPCPKCAQSMWTYLVRLERGSGTTLMVWRCVSCAHEWHVEPPSSDDPQQPPSA